MSRPVRAVMAASVLAAAALTLTACGSDGVAEQSKEHSVVTGALGEVGQVSIRNAKVTLGEGTSGLLAVAFYNAGEPDALTGLTSPAAGSFTLPTTSGTVNAYGDPSNNPSDDVATPAPGVGPASADQTAGVALPTGTGVFLGEGYDSVTIASLRAGLLVGNTIPVTFTFRAAGSITLQVPITATTQFSSTAPTPSDVSTTPAP